MVPIAHFRNFEIKIKVFVRGLVLMGRFGTETKIKTEIKTGIEISDYGVPLPL